VEETPVPKAIRVHKVPLAHKVLRAYRASLESKVQPVLKGHRVPKEHQVRKVIRATKSDAATTNLRAVQADGSVTCESSETLVSVFCPSGGAPDGAKCGTAPTVGLCLKKP
jgi:hypothetical protein